jgi:hypothetical protein
MGWLDAHESYVIEIIARDRVEELRSTVEVATAYIECTAAPAAGAPDARHRTSAGVALCPLALMKASR